MPQAAAGAVSIDQAQMLAWLSAFLLPMFRVLGLFTAAPVLSSRAVPARARVALAALVAVVAAPFAAVDPSLTGPVLGSPLAWAAVAHEVLIGLAMGFSARLVFAAFELAGELIGLQMGLSFAGFFDPSGGGGTAIGAFFGATGTLLFVALNGPLALIGALVQSFAVFPVSPEPLAFLTRLQPAAFGAEMFALALAVALPFFTLLLFVNLALGVIARVAPQLNVFAVGFPVTLGAGLLMLALAFPWIERPFAQAVGRAVALFGG